MADKIWLMSHQEMYCMIVIHKLLIRALWLNRLVLPFTKSHILKLEIDVNYAKCLSMAYN